MKTDTQLKNDVVAALRWAPTLDSSDINVAVQDGIVTLSGTVPHYAEKLTAERATQHVEGVKVIAEELDVNLSGFPKRPDADIAAAVASALEWHVWVPNQIQATIEQGWITLTGNVAWEFQRSAAESAVSYLTGISGISNNIKIKPEVPPTAIKEVVEKALKRNTEIDSGNIYVSTDAGDVTLTGSINSWGERREAATAAWNAPGVTSVENNLVVSA
jgi:osmotically-inducible protein OsmY